MAGFAWAAATKPFHAPIVFPCQTVSDCNSLSDRVLLLWLFKSVKPVNTETDILVARASSVSSSAAELRRMRASPVV